MDFKRIARPDASWLEDLCVLGLNPDQALMEMERVQIWQFTLKTNRGGFWMGDRLWALRVAGMGSNLGAAQRQTIELEAKIGDWAIMVEVISAQGPDYGQTMGFVA